MCILECCENPLHSLSLSSPLSLILWQAPHSVHMRSGVKFGDVALSDTMMKDGLIDAFHGYHMGITAENVVKQVSVSRQDQDLFSAQSQNKAETAQKNGAFTTEIIPVTVPSRKGTCNCKSDVLYCTDMYELAQSNR